MTASERSLETLKGGLDEVRSTLTSRNAQNTGIAAIAPLVMPLLENRHYEKSIFQAALDSRRVSLDSFYRGLFVTSVSVFEVFIKMFASALTQIRSQNANKFSDLPETFRQRYIVHAANVLSHVGSGSVKGIPYNFLALQNSIGLCFSDKIKPTLDGEVYTILMGNPTWERLTNLLKSLGIHDPFDQTFGSNTNIKNWGNATWKKNIAEAEAKLDVLMNKRNLIVHSAKPVSIVEQDIVEACNFFEAMARGLVDVMPTRIIHNVKEQHEPQQ